VVRIDKENKENAGEKIESQIINFFEEIIGETDAVILQDYNKGVLTSKIISEVISISNKYNKIISVDPKFINFKNYQNATIFKPNKRETENILGLRIESDKDISNAGTELLNLMNSKYVLLTLGEEGIALFEQGKEEIRIPTKARKVADVSGAGDTVISTITLTLCAGASIKEAAYIANYAGGLVCEEVGIVPISAEKLFNEISSEI
jgi:rfaE bifunctional protein kinase chain/domain